VAPCIVVDIYWGAVKSLARPTSRSILFDGENISFDASLVIYINSSNIPILLLVLQSALQPLVGFGQLYDFVSQSSVFTLLSPVSHFHLL